MKLATIKHGLSLSVIMLTMAAMLLPGLRVDAAMISTEQMVLQDARAGALDVVSQTLAQADVAARLEHWGVAPELVMQRVAALSDQELQQLAATIDSQPAGGALEVIGVVFVVLLILELLDITDVFKAI